MKILVCGGRSFGDIASLQKQYPALYQSHPLWDRREAEHDFIFRTLDLVAIECSQHYRADTPWVAKDLLIVSGAARGADTVAIEWAKQTGAAFIEYPAEWERYGPNYAGAIRNQEMLDKERPDMVIAFPGYRGTADMIRRAKVARVEVRQISHKLVSAIRSK